MEQVIVGLLGALTTAIGALTWRLQRNSKHPGNPSVSAEEWAAIRGLRDQQHREVMAAFTRMEASLIRLEGKM